MLLRSLWFQFALNMSSIFSRRGELVRDERSSVTDAISAAAVTSNHLQVPTARLWPRSIVFNMKMLKYLNEICFQKMMFKCWACGDLLHSKRRKNQKKHCLHTLSLSKRRQALRHQVLLSVVHVPGVEKALLGHWSSLKITREKQSRKITLKGKNSSQDYFGLDQ